MFSNSLMILQLYVRTGIVPYSWPKTYFSINYSIVLTDGGVSVFEGVVSLNLVTVRYGKHGRFSLQQLFVGD